MNAVFPGLERAGRRLLVLAAVVLLAGCVSVPAKRVAAGPGFVGYDLDSRAISLVVWNIQKGEAPDWPQTLDAPGLQAMVGKPDLLLLQEVCVDTPAHTGPLLRSLRAADYGWRFALSFESPLLGCGGGRATGVLTASSARPLETRALRSDDREFLLTPKTALASTYELAGSRETLLVVNAHMLNFQFFSDSDYRAQLQGIAEIIAAHSGPVLFAGDLNSRNQRRIDLLESTLAPLGLRDAFGGDTGGRTTDFLHGEFPLDQIYYRGLRLLAPARAGSEADAGLSDHNALFARFSLMVQAKH